MHLEIVSHCWDYSRLLTYQLSSLVLFPPTKLQVTISVFYAPDDIRTVQVLEHFSKQHIHNIEWKWRELPRPSLVRRAIGRNIVALETKADWIWFTDCDVIFRGCLDFLPSTLDKVSTDLCYPMNVVYSKCIRCGHQMLMNANIIQTLDINPSDFNLSRPAVINRAMGPFQIARTSALCDKGYCNLYPQFLQPSPDCYADRCPEDVMFRKTLGGYYYGTAINIPHVYVISHYEKGEGNSPKSRRHDRQIIGEL